MVYNGLWTKSIQLNLPKEVQEKRQQEQRYVLVGPLVTWLLVADILMLMVFSHAKRVENLHWKWLP